MHSAHFSYRENNQGTCLFPCITRMCLIDCTIIITLLLLTRHNTGCRTRSLKNQLSTELINIPSHYSTYSTAVLLRATCLPALLLLQVNPLFTILYNRTIHCLLYFIIFIATFLQIGVTCFLVKQFATEAISCIFTF